MFKNQSKLIKVLLVLVIVLSITTVTAACGLFDYLNIQSIEELINSGSSSNNYASADVLQVVSLTDEDKAMSWEDVADKLLPSVVCIINYAKGGNSILTTSSMGSGVIMNTSGYILTNNHVVEDAASLDVVLYDDTTMAAEIIGTDPYTDLAVIKIDSEALENYGKELTPAEFGDSNQLRVAQGVMAIGNPGGIEYSFSVTIGYVSALNRKLDINNGYLVNCIQTDAAINPGNSGGALVNAYGQVIGINSAKIVAEGYEGLGFAISSAEAVPIANELATNGKISGRASLGISGSAVPSYYTFYYGLPSGISVAQINTDNAKASGLKVNDIITKIDNVEVSSINSINSVLQSKKPGDVVTLKVYRYETKSSWRGSTIENGEYIDITVTLSELN